MKKPKTAAERSHLNKLASLGCIICLGPATIHHIRHNTGLGLKSSHFDAIPLCHNHHQGREGFHTLGKRAWEKKYGAQTDLLLRVKKLLGQ
jgi:hypothetical protein